MSDGLTSNNVGNQNRLYLWLPPLQNLKRRDMVGQSEVVNWVDQLTAMKCDLKDSAHHWLRNGFIFLGVEM